MQLTTDNCQKIVLGPTAQNYMKIFFKDSSLSAVLSLGGTTRKQFPWAPKSGQYPIALEPVD